MEKEFPGRTVLWPLLDAVCSPGFASGRSGPLTLDVTKMYRDNIAPDPGSLPRDTAGAAREPEFFTSWPVPLEACLPEKGGNPQEISFLTLYVASDRLPVRQFGTD